MTSEPGTGSKFFFTIPISHFEYGTHYQVIEEANSSSSSDSIYLHLENKANNGECMTMYQQSSMPRNMQLGEDLQLTESNKEQEALVEGPRDINTNQTDVSFESEYNGDSIEHKYSSLSAYICKSKNVNS